MLDVVYLKTRLVSLRRVSAVTRYVILVALDSEHGNWHVVDHHLLVVESVILCESI